MSRDGEPVLPDRPGDESDVGWGDRPDDEGEDRRLRDEVPPHHVDSD